jgi:hypothetical protein
MLYALMAERFPAQDADPVGHEAEDQSPSAGALRGAVVGKTSKVDSGKFAELRGLTI